MPFLLWSIGASLIGGHSHVENEQHHRIKFMHKESFLNAWKES